MYNANGHAIDVYVYTIHVSDGFICSLTYTYVWANARIPLRTVLCSPNIGMVLFYGENLYVVAETYLPIENSHRAHYSRQRSDGNNHMPFTLSNILRKWCVCECVFCIHSFPVLLFVHYYYYYWEFSVAIQYQPFSFISVWGKWKAPKRLCLCVREWVSMFVWIANKEWVYETVREYRVMKNSVRKSTR